jgi:hypothetical protein
MSGFLEVRKENANFMNVQYNSRILMFFPTVKSRI